MSNKEKMQKIRDLTGLEPKWWYNDEYWNINMTLERKEGSDPYYPCEQLWEMLPDTILSNGDDEEADLSEWRLIIERDNDQGVKYVQEMYGNTYDLVVSEFTGQDLHTALLDIFLWCIKNGYIASATAGKEV